MHRFMGIHTFPSNAFSHEQVCGLAKAAQEDSTVRGYRSFLNLSDGKAVCIMEAPDRQAVADWFDKMHMPYDSITEVEMEGDRGQVQELAAQMA